MHRLVACCLALLAPCLVAGCGSASGIKPGISTTTASGEPINPTPDMGPTPPKAAKK